MIQQFQKDEISRLDYTNLKILQNHKSKQTEYTIKLAILNLLSPRLQDIEKQIEYVRPNAICDICRKGFDRKFKQTNVCPNCYDV